MMPMHAMEGIAVAIVRGLGCVPLVRLKFRGFVFSVRHCAEAWNAIVVLRVGQKLSFGRLVMWFGERRAGVRYGILILGNSWCGRDLSLIAFLGGLLAAPHWHQQQAHSFWHVNFAKVVIYMSSRQGN